MLKVNPTVLPRVQDVRPSLGCDPEFFFKSKGEIIGAEKVLPKDGLNAHGAKFIIDGVQAELNPQPNICRAVLGGHISACFTALKQNLDSRKDGVTADFSQTIEISKENLLELSEASRKFGCAPSLSTSDKASGIKINEVDPLAYRVRAAGGHIHIGNGGHRPFVDAFGKDVHRTVNMLDILCGNTAVLLDRSEGNIERRKVYGKAGEYRLPKHGLEYRTLSNFWLGSYPLMSFAFGMARFAIQLMADANRDTFYKAYTKAVNIEDVQLAINTNDYDLALQNFQAIEELIKATCHATGTYPINANNMKEFYFFADSVRKHGIDKWFGTDPMTYWTKDYLNGGGFGFNDFLLGRVRQTMNARSELEKEHEAQLLQEASINKLLVRMGAQPLATSINA